MEVHIDEPKCEIRNIVSLKDYEYQKKKKKSSLISYGYLFLFPLSRVKMEAKIVTVTNNTIFSVL